MSASFLSQQTWKKSTQCAQDKKTLLLTNTTQIVKKENKKGGGSTFKTSSLISHTQQVQVLEFTVSLKDKELQYAEWQHILIPITSILSDASSKDTAKEQLVFFIFCALVHWPLQY